MSVSDVVVVQWRAVTDEAIDNMLDAIHLVADMRARDVDEDTVTLALAERVALLKITMEHRFGGY